MEHIEPWSEVREHNFENMIVLCAVCHSRITKGEISKRSVEVFKRNLAIINGRYSLYEVRLMEAFWQCLSSDQVPEVTVSEGDYLHFKGLLDDRLVEALRGPTMVIANRNQSPLVLRLSGRGRGFVARYFAGDPVENEISNMAS